MSYSNFPSDYKKTLSRNLFLFKCIGIDFFDDSTSYFTKNNFKCLIFCIIFYPFVADHFSLISKIKAENFMESVRVLPVCIILFLNIVKMLIAIIRKSELRAMFLEIGELWPRELQSDEQKSVILKTWLRRMQPILNFYFYYVLVNIILFEVIPFLKTSFNICNGDRIYLFPFEPTNLWAVDSIFIYLVTYLWQVAVTIPCQLCLCIPFDLTIVTLTSNVSALLRLLQVDLKNAIRIHDLPVEERPSNDCYVSDPEGYEQVKKIAARHQILLRLADQFNRMFGIVIFIPVAFAAIEICFFGFLTVVYGGIADTIANFLSALNAMFTIFLLTLSGQFIADTSTEVADAAYESYWYQSDVRVRKLILFIIIRAQRPSYLSALGFSNLTLRSFSKIMSSSWTYFSLLIQVYQKN